MKFCKNLVEVVELSHPEWVPFWMDYKSLKKRLNRMARKDRGGRSKRTRRDVGISKDESEVQFFSALMAELRKTEDFYKGAETEFRIRVGRVREGVRQVHRHHVHRESDSETTNDSDSVVGLGEESCAGCPRRRRSRSACVRVYKDLLLLETYALMSYCAFSKILKKHDKLTGHSTRKQYMSRVVSPMRFSKYQGVVKMLRECKELFKRLETHVTPRGTRRRQNAGEGLHPLDGSAEMGPRLPLQEEEQLFIDVIRNLNSEAATLMQDEQKETEEESMQMGLGESTSTPIVVSSIASCSASECPVGSRDISVTQKQTRRKRRRRS